MAINKVIFNNTTIFDLTSDTVTAAGVSEGKYVHLADGTRVQGTKTSGYAVIPVSSDETMGTVSGGGVAKGSITVTATITSSSYKFVNWTVNGTEVSTSATYTFTPSADTLIVANFDNALEIVSWASGTASQLKAMIDAHYAGSIDLTDYWSLGDTRTVTLPAMSATSVGESHDSQSVQLVLMDSTCTGFTLTTEQIAPAFIVGMKECLNEQGYMNNTDITTNGWSGSARRAWCNATYKAAMDSIMPNIFKQFTWKQGQGDGATSGLLETNDYFALPPEKAILGSISFGQTDEAALYSNWWYYQTSSNRIKKVNGTAQLWWEASAGSGQSNRFCRIRIDGTGSRNAPSNNHGISPFGCI